MPKKVSSDLSYTLTYLTLKYERNRIFHPCRGILILSDFYRQALLIAVVILFELCRLPIYINQFILFFDREKFPCGPLASFVFMPYFLGHANSAINPSIYAIFNRNFRKGFIDVLLCGCYRNRSIAAQTNPHRNRQNTSDPNVDDARVRPRRVHSTSL